jgi:hypothetical protein
MRRHLCCTGHTRSCVTCGTRSVSCVCTTHEAWC